MRNIYVRKGVWGEWWIACDRGRDCCHQYLLRESAWFIGVAACVEPEDKSRYSFHICLTTYLLLNTPLQVRMQLNGYD